MADLGGNYRVGGIKGANPDPASQITTGPKVSSGSSRSSSKPKTGKVTVRASAGPLTAEEAKRFTNAQIVYENRAGEAEVAQRALGLARDITVHNNNKMMALRARWRLINHMLRGNSLVVSPGMEPIHVPELYKKVETLVPRIEEALTEYDPWFRVRGRSKDDRDRAPVIQAFLDWQLDQMRIKDQIQPAIRSMLTYQVAVAKLWWAREIEERPVKSKVEEIIHDDGSTTYKIHRELRNEVVYEGPKSRLIDPFDLIIDTRAGTPETARYIGEESSMSYGEMMRLQDLGIFQNVEKLAEIEPTGHSPLNTNDYDKQARSVTERYDQGRRQAEGEPKVYRVCEIWGEFDLDGTGAKESVITVAEGTVVLRAMENPHDHKVRPYAVARAAVEGFDFFNTGVLDNAIRTNIELDYHRTLALHAHRLSVSPLIFTGEDSDLPGSVLDVAPGHIFHAVGDVTFSKVPDTLSSISYIEGTLRTDIEEITGSPKVFEGSSAGAGTATEFMGALREGNRRVRGLVRSLAGMYEKTLSVMYAMNDQFIIKKTPFRVLGKEAFRLLGPTGEVDPGTFMRAVDFEFLGPANLSTNGMRATNLLQFVQTMMPVIQMHPDKVNMLGILRQLYELMVGKLQDDEIIEVPRTAENVIPQVMENQILLQGEDVEVSPADDDEEHLRDLLPLLRGDHPDRVSTALKKHALKHTMQLQKKRAIKKSQTQGPFPVPPGFGTQQSPAGGGGSPVAGGLSPQAGGTPGSPGGQLGGETPGPAQNRTMGVAGRGGSGIPQEQNGYGN